jgi:hypothetical protein
MPPQYYYPPEDDTIDLVDLVKTLWRYRLWMVALTAAAVIGAAVYVQIAPKTYTASVIYELKNQPEAEARLKGLYQTRAFLGYFLEESGYLPQVLNDLYDPSTKTYQITDDRLSAVELGAARLQSSTTKTLQTPRSRLKSPMTACAGRSLTLSSKRSRI